MTAATDRLPVTFANGHDQGIAAVVTRWYASPVTGTEDWNEVGCGTGIADAMASWRQPTTGPI